MRGILVRRVSLVSLSIMAAAGLLAACSSSLTFDRFKSEPEIAGVTFIESVDSERNQIVIPYSKYRLDNGLTVIIHEDTSDPLVHVDVTYHVGSAREEARRSGFAHFFEHMMFQGSKNVDDDEHFKIVTEAGGTMNGTTNNDRTNYFQTVPSNNLETMLWLESDRMGYLLDAVTQEKFEVQRATVKNERGQNFENRPYGLWSEKNAAALYPAGHPYSWSVIGDIKDLDAATVEDLRKFFLRWYGPNNATLTIGGNVDKTETLALVVKYFGAIPAGPEVVDQSPMPVTIDNDRYISYVDKNIRFPALLLTYPTVEFSHQDRVALECLADILGSGRKSYLYKQFVLPRKAIDASAFNSNMELAGSLTLFVMPFPGVSLSEFEGEIRQLISSFDADSISDDDILMYKSTREANLISGLASVRGKVSRLAYYETFYDDPNRIRSELEALRTLTKDDVLRVFETYVKNKPAVIQSVVAPSDPDGVAKPDNFEFPERPERQASETAELQPRPIVDDFDRSQQPQPGPAPLVEVPKFWRGEIGREGALIPAIGVSSSELPLITIELKFSGGQLIEDPSLAGIASLTAAMMNEGTQNYSAEEFEIALDKLGSRISVNSDRENLYIYVSALSDRIDETLALLEERLFASKFTEEDLQRLRQQQVESIQASQQEPQSIASDVFRKLIYGADHPRSVSTSGRVETLENISLQDVRNYSQASFLAGALDVVVVGDISRRAAQNKLAFLAKLPPGETAPVAFPESPEYDQTTLYFVDKPGAHQSEIRLGYLTDLTYDVTGEYFKRALMNFVLGGTFSSRINLNLREDKGYTYGARSGFSGGHYPGPFSASAGVKREATADSVRQFINEIDGYRTLGIEQHELTFMQSAIGQRDALSYETPRQKAGFLAKIQEYNLSEDFVEQQLAIINGMTKQEVDQLAKQHLPIEKMIILVVGDKEFTFESLEDLGYPIVELDASGKPIEDSVAPGNAELDDAA
ncbi:pitrilysin family protein [Aurantivibrio plasticivorans]